MRSESGDALPPASLSQEQVLERPVVEQAAPVVAEPVSFLDSIIAVGPGKVHAATSRLERFLSATDPAHAIAIWLDGASPGGKSELARRLTRDIAAIDKLLNEQLNAILHQPAFQKLEASWRGLRYLVDKADAEGDPGIRIRVLNISWREIERDFEKASEFDQSNLFHKIYSDEFGMPGGIPYGMLLADYEIHPAPGTDHPHDDIGVVKSLSQVAAAAFSPLVIGTHPSLFGLEDFSTLEQRLDHAATFNQLDYLKWRALRDSEDSRFVAAVMPRVLMRLPYEDDGTRVDRFQFREEVAGPDRSKYLWGNAAYAFGGVVMRAMARAGWPADIRGAQRGIDGGGLITGLPSHTFSTDKSGLVPKSSTDVTVTDELERHLGDLGFISVCRCKDTPFSAFYGNASLQKPKTYDRAPATANAKMSSMLMYMLCVSRFAHYIKIIGRDKVGSFLEPGDLQSYLQSWITRYVTPDPEASTATKAKFPLREANVEVKSDPSKPGSFQCVLHLSPHYQLDEVSAKVRVVTELAPPRTS